MFQHLLGKWFPAIAKRRPIECRQRGQSSRRTYRPCVELLEDRWVPSTFVVNELIDTHAASLVSGMDATGHVSLRSAIAAADHLGGNQTIEFDPTVFATPHTITLTLGLLDLKDTSGVMTIQGPAAGVTVSGNHASEVFRVESGTTADLTGLTIIDGKVIDYGGGIYNNGTLNISDSIISGNTAPSYNYFQGGKYYVQGNGGGIYNKGLLTLTNSTITGNSAGLEGGGLFNDGTARLTDCTVSDNSSSHNDGGGIINEGIASLNSSTISDNSALWGGGILNDSSLTVTDSIISGNKANYAGGGIYNGGTATVLDSTLSGNSTSGSGGGISGGDALYSISTTVLNSCTLSANSAGSGGGIYSGNPMKLANCTICGNTATSEGGGVWASGQATLSNCTISGNTAVKGGGVFNNSSLTLDNSIVAANGSHSGDGDLVGPVSSPSVNNLIGDGTGISSGIRNGINGNLVGTPAVPINPLLAPLGNYGGPTQTMALLPGSPAIDAGSNAAIPVEVTTDQRGEPRIVNGTVDIGAFESQGFALSAVSGNDQSGTLGVPLPSPLVVAVTAENPVEPVGGGQLTFAVSGSSLQEIQETIDSDGQASLTTFPPGTVAGPCSVTVSAAGVPANGSVGFQLTNNPLVIPATTIVPDDANLASLVIRGAGFDPGGTNSVTIIDLTEPANIVTIGSLAVNSTTQLTVQVSSTLTDGDVLSAVVTTDGASSAPTEVAVVAPILTPATTLVPANANAATLVINGVGFDPYGTNAVTMADFTHPADSVSVVSVAASSTTALNVTFSGSFTVGDALSAVVTTDGARSAAATVASAAPVVTPAAAHVPAKAALNPLVIHGFGFDSHGSNTVTIVDSTHPADKVTIGKITVTSATSLTVTLSGTFTAGDVLSAVVTTDKKSSTLAPVAVTVQTPAITSAADATFVARQASSFTITTTGFPMATLSKIGTLPAGVTWINNGNGTATIKGAPAASAARAAPYTFTVEASNGVGAVVTQTFELTIELTPVTSGVAIAAG